LIGGKTLEKCERTKRVLGFCDEAIWEIRDEMPTGDLWERRWASLLALLRTATEVLKADAPIFWELHMKKPNAGAGGRDPKKNWRPDIFGKFIWTDANLFLHEGLIRVAQSIMPHGSNMQKIVQGLTGSQNQELPPPHFSYHMNSEPYSGQGELEVSSQAVRWLKQQVEITER
jgi:hypothetical protein